MNNHKSVNQNVSSNSVGKNGHDCAVSDVSTTCVASQDGIHTEYLKDSIEVIVHPSADVVHRKSEDGGSSRASTLIGSEIGRAIKGDISKEAKWMSLSLVTLHTAIILANVTLAATLLQHTGPNTMIRAITIKLSLFSTYFDPLAIFITVAVWDLFPRQVRSGFFAVRLILTLVSAIMIGQDAGSCSKATNADGKSPCQTATALSALMYVSLPLLAFEILCVGLDSVEKEEGKAKTTKSSKKARQNT